MENEFLEDFRPWQLTSELFMLQADTYVAIPSGIGFFQHVLPDFTPEALDIIHEPGVNLDKSVLPARIGMNMTATSLMNLLP